VRLKPNSAIIQFAIEAFDVRFEKRALDLERQIANPHIEKVLVRKAMPGKAITHARSPFVAAALLTEDNNPGNSGLGEEKHQLMTTVICAGNSRSRFRISGAGSL
jgi:hypothetical protein